MDFQNVNNLNNVEHYFKVYFTILTVGLWVDDIWSLSWRSLLCHRQAKSSFVNCTLSSFQIQYMISRGEKCVDDHIIRPSVCNITIKRIDALSFTHILRNELGLRNTKNHGREKFSVVTLVFPNTYTISSHIPPSFF